MREWGWRILSNWKSFFGFSFKKLEEEVNLFKFVQVFFGVVGKRKKKNEIFYEQQEVESQNFGDLFERLE